MWHTKKSTMQFIEFCMEAAKIDLAQLDNDNSDFSDGEFDLDRLAPSEGIAPCLSPWKG